MLSDWLRFYAQTVSEGFDIDDNQEKSRLKRGFSNRAEGILRYHECGIPTSCSQCYAVSDSMSGLAQNLSRISTSLRTNE